LPFKRADNLWDVLKEVRDDQNPRAHAIVGYNWEHVPTGQKGAHSENIAKRNGMVTWVNPQDLKNKWAPVVGFRFTNITYLRTDKGVPDIRTDGWATGSGAFNEMDSIINGPAKTRGFVRATLDGKPVLYQLFTAEVIARATRYEGSKKIEERIDRDGSRRMVWDTWKRLENPQVKRVPDHLLR
jgi:hypothetical protein